jgi:hypothetical protein
MRKPDCQDRGEPADHEAAELDRELKLRDRIVTGCQGDPRDTMDDMPASRDAGELKNGRAYNADRQPGDCEPPTSDPNNVDIDKNYVSLGDTKQRSAARIDKRTHSCRRRCGHWRPINRKQDIRGNLQVDLPCDEYPLFRSQDS